MFFAIAVSKSVFYVTSLFWFYVTFRYIGLTSGMRKCYKNSNLGVQFISNHILPHRLNINDSCTQCYSYDNSIGCLNMKRNPFLISKLYGSILFSNIFGVIKFM